MFIEVIMAQGWVSLNREIAGHWVWDCEFSTGQAWVDLILHANHKPAKIIIKGQLIDVLRGQQARSELTLSKQWKWSRNKVRRFLKNLENDGMIEVKSGHLTTVITICKYNDFQSNDTASDTAKGQQTEQQKDNTRNTNNNVNNEDNGNKPLAQPEAKQSKFKFNDEQMRFAEWVFGKVKSVMPSMKNPNLDNWANTARLMCDSDGLTLKRMAVVFNWANSNNFWQSNILSMDKFRKQFAQLEAKMPAEKKQSAPVKRPKAFGE